MIKSTNFYNLLKYLGRIILPAISALYVALAAIWGWPLSEEIAGTIAAVVVFINSLLEISNAKFNALKDKADADDESK